MDNKNIKIAFVGNQGNNAYRLCRWLRQLNYNVDLYRMKGEAKHQRSDPKFIHRDINVHGYPDWFYEYDDNSQYYFLRKSKVSRHIEKNYDLVVTSGCRAIFSGLQFTEIPVVHLNLGFEVNVLPLQIWKRTVNSYNIFHSYMARKALRKCQRIVAVFEPSIRALCKLKLDKKIFFRGFSEDVIGNKKLVDNDLLNDLNKKYASYDKVFLWLSRLCFLDKDAPAYKGPERFFCAFKKIITKKYNVKAIIGRHGHDVEAFDELIKQEKLEEYIDFVPHLQYWELSTYLSIQNAVVFDTINPAAGGIFGMAREALSCGAVIVKTNDIAANKAAYGPGCPIINAFDEESCFDAMVDILSLDEDQFSNLKESSYEWAMKYLHFENSILSTVAMLEATVICDKVSKKYFRRR